MHNKMSFEKTRIRPLFACQVTDAFQVIFHQANCDLPNKTRLIPQSDFKQSATFKLLQFHNYIQYYNNKINPLHAKYTFMCILIDFPPAPNTHICVCKLTAYCLSCYVVVSLLLSFVRNYHNISINIYTPTARPSSAHSLFAAAAAPPVCRRWLDRMHLVQTMLYLEC